MASSHKSWRITISPADNPKSTFWSIWADERPKSSGYAATETDALRAVAKKLGDHACGCECHEGWNGCGCECVTL